jgi:hypothetical protein
MACQSAVGVFSSQNGSSVHLTNHHVAVVQASRTTISLAPAVWHAYRMAHQFGYDGSTQPLSELAAVMINRRAVHQSVTVSRCCFTSVVASSATYSHWMGHKVEARYCGQCESRHCQMSTVRKGRPPGLLLRQSTSSGLVRTPAASMIQLAWASQGPLAPGKHFESV